MTALQKRRKKEAKAERQKKYEWVFMNGKQIRRRRTEKIEGMNPNEFMIQNADELWRTQNGYYEILFERKIRKEQKHNATAITEGQ